MPPDPPNSLICSVFLALAAAGPLQCERVEPPVLESHVPINCLIIKAFWTPLLLLRVAQQNQSQVFTLCCFTATNAEFIRYLQFNQSYSENICRADPGGVGATGVQIFSEPIPLHMRDSC